MFIVAQQTDFRSQLNSWQARVLFLTVVQARTLTSTRNFQLFKGFYLHPSRNSNTPPSPPPPHIILQVTTVPFQSHSPPFRKQQHPPPPPHHLTGHDCPFPVTQSTLPETATPPSPPTSSYRSRLSLSRHAVYPFDSSSCRTRRTCLQ
jgi:hypothetical protein